MRTALLRPGNKQKNLRILFFAFLVIIIFSALVLRLWYLQIIQGSLYGDLSKNNRIRLVRVKSPRGIIYDRNLIPVVTNRPMFDAGLVLEDVQEGLDNIIATLTQVFEFKADQLKSTLNQKHQPFQFVPIKRDLSFEEVARLEEDKLDLPGMLVQVEPVRSYPFGEMAAHLLGYVGEISEQQLNNPLYQKFQLGDFIGKAGVEREFNLELTGTDGGKQVEVNAQGRELAVLGELEPEPGFNLVLTIDSRLQLLAEKLLEDKAGAVIALNPNNGNVLCLASKPAFDPNKFAIGISRKDWNAILTDLNNPLQNRVIQSQYPPGSVFKTVMATAALEKGIIDEDTTLSCNGTFHLRHWSYDCWKSGGHGRLQIHQALVQSCNVFFYQVGQQLGIENIAQMAYTLGLGRATGIDLPDEKIGLVPTPEWKLKSIAEKWQPGETISISIGQGYLSATPIQLANMISAIANGGTLYKPLIIDRIVTTEGQTKRIYHPEVLSKTSLSSLTLEIVRQGLYGVVNEQGTGTRARIPGLDIAGKTGTAQVVSKSAVEEKEEADIPDDLKDHAWFVAFAPVESAEIALAVFVEHGGHGGSACAPIARELIREYFSLKQNKEDHV
jgi:penicillin-binding protein 2